MENLNEFLKIYASLSEDEKNQVVQFMGSFRNGEVLREFVDTLFASAIINYQKAQEVDNASTESHWLINDNLINEVKIFKSADNIYTYEESGINAFGTPYTASGKIGLHRWLRSSYDEDGTRHCGFKFEAEYLPDADNTLCSVVFQDNKEEDNDAN